MGTGMLSQLPASVRMRIRVYESRRSCPGCGEDLLYSRCLELHDWHVGVTQPSWSLYYCRKCGSWFKVFWPSLMATALRLEQILAAEGVQP